MKKLLSLLVVIFLFSPMIAPHIVFACGCGLALTGEERYQSLEEPEAYLVVKAFDEKTFELKPFFRLYSTDPAIGTIPVVFPIDQVPTQVVGKRMSSYEFQSDVGISEAQSSHDQFIDAQDDLARSLEAASAAVGQGVVATTLLKMVTMQVTSSLPTDNFQATASVPEGAIAHFEFEGGTLDVFDPAQMGTLGEFAASLDTELASSVTKMVEKYKTSYIAVMNLDVPTVGEDGEQGNLVSMRFENADHFFYPTSLTSSYARPVPNLGYYISTPSRMEPKLATGVQTDWTTRVQDQRWYRISMPPLDDLRGTFVQSSIVSRGTDIFQSVVTTLAPFTFLIGIFFFLLLTGIVVLLVVSANKTRRSPGFLMIATCLYVVGGLFFLLPLAFITKRFHLGVMLLAAWLLLFTPTVMWFISTVRP